MITKRRDLRDGKTVWEGLTPKSIVGCKQPARRFYDVIIIGAGITGALVAEALSEQKLDVLVVDRRAPASGSTSASTALIQWEIDEPLGALSHKIGRARAQTAYRASYRAVSQLKQKITALKLDVDLRSRDTLLLAGNEMGFKALQNETNRRRAIGLPSHMLDADKLRKLYGFEREGAILSRGSVEVDPRKLALALLTTVMKRGVELVSPANVTMLYGSPSGVFVTLDGKQVIAANKVIAATGYEALPEIPKGKYDLISTWALATVRQREGALWPERPLVWEASDPYLYFRSTADNRIVVGGEDATFFNPAKRDALTGKKVQRILKKFGKLWPKANLTADYTWSGTFAESPTGLPVIGPVDAVPNLFAILGAGGNGITFSVIASDLARAWVAGRPHKLAEIFAT